jgi:sugar diacid utilization regulator
MLTVREAFSIGRLQEGEVIAGEKGLNRAVNYIDIMEVPDVADWLKSGELILTTGYAIKDKPDMQVKLVEQLAKVEGAGIIIKLNRFLDEVPEIMIKKANELDIPIMKLPSNIPYIDITHVIMKEILLRQNKERWLNEMLWEVLSSSFSNVNELKKKIRLINDRFEVASSLVLVMVNYNRLKQIEHLIRFNTIKDNPGIIYGQINDNYIFICEAKHESNWREETLKKIFNLEAIKETSANHIICLISRVINNPIQLQNEYKRLNDALKIVRQLTNKKLVYYYDDIVHYVFFKNLCVLETTREFIDYVLEPFNRVEEKERSTLLNTLYLLAMNNGNLSRTAQKSFMHINTLRYRVKKIKDLLKISEISPEELFKYSIALVLYKYIKENK